MNTKRITSIICMLFLFVSSMLATTFEYKGLKYEVISSTDQTVTVAVGNSVTGDITIPKLVMDASTATAYRVISISANAFKDCTELTSVTIKAELTSIGASAFANSGLTSINIPEGVTAINESTFSGCTCLSTITIPSHLSSIGEMAFYHTAITSLDLNLVTAIGKSAFEGCSNLKNINCSYKTLTLGENAFKDCAALENLNLENNSYDYVDLGLPSGTLWATCNVGAESPEEYGLYFAWGETTPPSSNDYSWSNYKWCNGSYDTMTKYCTDSNFGTVDNKTVLDAEDDAATVNWGSEWCMPTRAQLEELFNSSYTTTTWTTEQGVYGRKITSNTNGNSIFLPAAGIRSGGSLYSQGFNGRYWSSELYSGSSCYAWELPFGSNCVFTDSYNGRCAGQSVRPVRCSASE